MALRFYAEISNIRRELFKVEIHDSSFSGSSTEFTLRGNGFDLSYNGGKETYQLIKSSTLTFVMNITDATLRALPIDIAASDSVSRFAVKLYRDDTYTAGNNYTPDGSNYELYWAGVINKRIMSVQDTAYPYDFRISAVDGIELLKNYTFKDSNGYVFESRISLKEFLLKVIDKLDFGNNFSATDTVLATRINWFETNHSLSDSVAAKTYMYQSVFNEVDSNGEAKLSTYYSVLKHLCDLFQCRFMLYEGKFWYTQFSRLKESSNSYHLYKLNGSVGSPSSLTKTINDISGEIGGVNATGGTVSTARSGFYLREKTYGQKLTSIKIVWNALSDESQNIYPLTYFPVWQMPNMGWVPYGQGSYGPNLSGYFEDGDEISFKIKLSFSVTISRDSTADAQCNTPLPANNFYGRVVVPFWFLAKDNGNVFTNYRWWRGKGSNNNDNGVFNFQNTGICNLGDWHYSATSAQTAMKFRTGMVLMNPNTETGTSQTFTFDVEINTQPVPVAEVEGVYFYNDYDGNWDSSLSSGDWFAIEDSSGSISSADNWQGYAVTVNYLGANTITVAPYQDGEPFIGSTTDSYVTEDSSDSTNPEELVINTIKWGDGPSAVGVRTLWVDNGASIVQSNLWQINNTGSTYKIHKLITDEILNYNWFSGERLEAQIYQPPNLYESQPLNISEGFNRDYRNEEGFYIYDELYAFSTLSYNPQMASWTFKGKKISIPIPTVVTNPDTDTLGEELKPIPPQPSSMNSQNDEDESCKLNQVLSPLDTSTTSITVTGVSSDLNTASILLIQSCSPDRQWEKITLSSSATKNDTTLNINAFTPTFTYDETSTILVSRTTLVSSGGGGGSTSPGGSNTQVQFNDGGSFGAESDFTYNKTSNSLSVTGRFEGSNIGSRTFWNNANSYLYYYLNPSDFNLSSNSNVNIYSRDKGGSVVSSAYDSRSDDTMAFVNLPVGYEIKDLIVYSNVNITFVLEYGSYNTDTITSIQSGGTTNSTLTLSSAETVDERRYYIVRVVYTATSDEIWGGRITLEKV
jgi:hypothetical protein